MAIEQEAVTEDSLFDSAVGDTPPEPSPAPVAATPAPVEQPRTEQAAPAPTPPDPLKTERPAVDDDAPQVPSWRVREINEEKRAAQAERDSLKQERDRLAYQQQEYARRLAELQKPAEPKAEEPPDPILDPRGYQAHMERRFEERLAAERREASLHFAHRIYGQEFAEAYRTAVAKISPALRAEMQASSDPGETLMAWYREQKTRAEVGNDLTAYNKKREEELLNNPEFRKRAMETWEREAQGQVGGRPIVALPPSLNGMSRSSAALRASKEEFSDDALWDQTTT